MNRFDAGPVRLASIAHAFNYRVAVLRDGIKQATRTARSKKVKRSFLDDVSLTLGQQVEVMFQIVCALALDVPAAAGRITDVHGVSPDMLLSYGHADHAGVACGCRSSDRTRVYVHAVATAHDGRSTHVVTAAQCNLVPIWDMTGGFPAVVAPGTCQDFAWSAPTVPVPTSSSSIIFIDLVLIAKTFNKSKNQFTEKLIKSKLRLMWNMFEHSTTSLA